MKSFILRDNSVRDRAIAYIASLPLEPLLEVDVYEHTKKRTSQQNKLYHAELRDFASATPHSKDVWHFHFKKEFLGYEEVMVMGKVNIIPFSTATLNTKEFSDYYMKCRVFMDEYKAGIHT